MIVGLLALSLESQKVIEQYDGSMECNFLIAALEAGVAELNQI